MNNTQPEPEDADTFRNVIFALLIALIPFLYALRATIALSSRRNKETLLAEIDAAIIELRAMIAQHNQTAEPASPHAPATHAPHPPAANFTATPPASTRRPQSRRAPQRLTAQKPAKPHSHAPPP